MNLIFKEDDRQRRCGSKVLEKGFKVRCANLTSRTVTIQTGLHYFDGKLNRSQSKLRSTIPICDIHESGMKSDFEKLFGKN
jgi:hypothetical protein